MGYNRRNHRRNAKFNGGLRQFENIHEDMTGMILCPAPSLLDTWKGKPNIPFYDDCIKVTVNRMIYLNPTIAQDCDYFYFGSWFNRDLEYQKQLIEYFKNSSSTKFGAAYENNVSHRVINRGNIYPEQCKKYGIIPFENNLKEWSEDLFKYSGFGHSICFGPAQMFLYMGMKLIYLVGCDCGYTLENQKRVKDDAQLIAYWKGYKKWYKSVPKYKDVKIASINPISLKGMFDVDIQID